MGPLLKLLIVAVCILFFCTEIQAQKQKSSKKQNDANQKALEKRWSKVKEREEQLVKLKQKLKYLEKRNSILTQSLQKRNTVDKQRCQHLLNKITRTEKDIENLKQQLAICTEQACGFDAMKIKLAKLLTDYGRLELQLGLLPQQVESCNIQTPLLSDRVEILQNINKDLIEKITKLEEELNTCTETNVNLYDTIENIVAENDDLTNQINDLIKEIESLKTKVAECIAKKTADLHATLDQLQKIHDSLDLSQRALTVQETIVHNNLGLCVERNNDLSNEIESLQSCNITIKQLRRQCAESLNGLQPLVNLDDTMYYFSTDQMRTFQGAIEFCRAHGMELATVDTSAKDRLITNQINQLMGSTTGKDSYYYFGLNDRFLADFYTFVGTGGVIDFKNWAQGQPDNLEEGFRCVVYDRPNVFVNNWKVVDCRSRARFICELAEPCNNLNFVSMITS